MAFENICLSEIKTAHLNQPSVSPLFVVIYGHFMRDVDLFHKDLSTFSDLVITLNFF